MQISFDNYLRQKFELKKQTKIILTVSGGADSVVMLDLFAKSQYRCCIAHCNFHLRGNESDADEKFVEKLAVKYNYPFFKSDFDTKAYAEEKSISIEMSARELRYIWFEELRQKYDYKYIATAHHQNDIIETFFINLLRGTGIRGLSGIKPIKGNIIRPMLFANRSMIMEYIKDKKLEFREDSTNSDIKIIRNKLRHQILPLLNEINPAANENIIKSIENLQDAEKLVQKEIIQTKLNLGIETEGSLIINIEKLKKITPIKAYLFEIFHPYGFNSNQIKDIENSLDAESGKCFYSKTHQIVKNRDELLLNIINQSKPFRSKLSDSDKLIDLPEGRKLFIEKIKRTEDFKIPIEQNIAAIDVDQLKYPLLMREWEQGDIFYPLGMKKMKKLSDFFIDEKYSLIDKQKTLILISDNQIVWVIGKRIDNRFKITDKTSNILTLRIIND